ncbi:MAG: hypothetical protein ACREP9_17100, partial [Candidatus Dormibacteraceae bacterium]
MPVPTWLAPTPVGVPSIHIRVMFVPVRAGAVVVGGHPRATRTTSDLGTRGLTLRELSRQLVTMTQGQTS